MDKQLYDLTSLKEVCGGDEGFMQQMIDLFKTNIPQEISQIEEAISNSDYEPIKAIAHKMKPSVSYICVDSMLKDISEIEEWKEDDSEMVNKTTVFIKNLSTVITQL